MIKTKLIKNLCCGFLLLSCIPIVGLSQANHAWDWLISTENLEGKFTIGEHPRGLISPKEVPEIRQRIKLEPYKSWYENFRGKTREKAREFNSASMFEAKEAAELAANQCFMYTFTGKQKWSRSSYKNLTKVFKDEEIFNNPISRGLNRAAMLRDMAMAYDHCYSSWSQQQRYNVNCQIYKITYATSANMGLEVNYSLVSNWMGVRWGAVMFASLVWDNPTVEEQSIMEPLRWNSYKRISDHIELNILKNGWNTENMWYHNYNWSFIGPAPISFQNKFKENFTSALKKFAPDATNTMWGLMTSAVAIETHEGNVGVKADLSDDNQNMEEGLLGMSFRLYPEEQLPAIKWMHDYLDESTIYSLPYYPNDVETKNPVKLDWLTYVDKQPGVVVFRNRFQDENDIVATYNASAERSDGHWGPDVNTVRLVGLGSFFVDGAGRTQLVAGQTNLFPGSISEDQEGIKSEGTFLGYQTKPDGSGYACGLGSNTGVKNQQTCLLVDYSMDQSKKGIFVLDYKSDNGEIWRLNTPDYNSIDIHTDGFTITNPDRATLRVQVLGIDRPLDITTGRVRYGGETVWQNTGINYRGKHYKNNKWVDVENNGNFTIVMTLYPKGGSHHQVSSGENTDEIQIGEKLIQLPKCDKN